MPEQNYLLTEAAVRTLKADHARLAQQVGNLSKHIGAQFNPQTAAPQKPDLFCNNDTEEVPAYGVMACSGSGLYLGRDVINVVRPKRPAMLPVFINGRRPIASDGIGKVQRGPLFKILYDDADGTPAFGETWGAKEGQYSLGKDQIGFTCLKVIDAENKIMLATSKPLDGIPFVLSASGSPGPVPPYGVMVEEVAGPIAVYDGVPHLTLRAPRGPEYDRHFFINGPVEVAQGTSGRGICYMAGDRPIRAKYNSHYGTSTSLLRCTFGGAPGDFDLHPGLPGLECYGKIDGTAGTVHVVRSTRTFHWVQATQNWNASGSSPTQYGPNDQNLKAFTVRPVRSTDSPSEIYNGSGANGTYPDISFLAQIYYDVTQMPCIFQNDMIQICLNNDFQSPRRWQTAPGAYLGPPRYTVQMWAINTTPPRGWAIMNGTANSVGNGGTGYDMSSRFVMGGNPGSSGGASTHTHALATGSQVGSGTFRSATTDAASSLPPYRTMQFIERLST